MDASVRAGVWQLTAPVCSEHTHTHTVTDRTFLQLKLVHDRLFFFLSYSFTQKLSVKTGSFHNPCEVCLLCKQNSHLDNNNGQPRSTLATALTTSKSTYRSLHPASTDRAKGHNTVGDYGNDCSPRSSVVYLSSLKD